MARDKTPSYKSFGSIPREKFEAVPTADSNKIASFKEDMYNLSHSQEDEDAAEYRSQVVNSEAKPPISESSEVVSLRKRIDYYKNSTVEDPRIKEMQLRQLEIRLQEALNRPQEEPALPAKGLTQASETTETMEVSEVSVDASEASASVLQNNKDPQQMKDQMSRLVKTTSRLRNEAGLTAQEALEESSDYKELKSEISRIRYRLNKILEEKGKVEYKEEIIQLRHELAEHLVAFKKLSREKAKENSEKDPEPEPVIEPEPEPTPTELKDYEKRRLLRDEWKLAKDTYMNAYEQHLSDVKSKNAQKNVLDKMAFWKKENKSPALIAAEQAYQDARKNYADLLNGALESRADTDRGGDLEGYQAGLANRFVINAAHEKLAREKEYLPDAKSLRVFEKLQEVLKKHKTLIKRSGYLMVVGIGLVSGGVGTALFAFGSKAVGAKLATVGAAGGATLGAYLGNSFSDANIDYTAQRRDSAAQRAQRKFSLETMDKREKEYIERYRTHEQALRDKNFYVGVGALAGGTLGAIALGNLDNVTDIELPEELPVAPPVPPELTIPELRVPEVDIPEQVIPSIPQMPTEPEVMDVPKSIDNFEKDEAFKNAPSVPEVPPDDVTYFERPDAPALEPEIVPEVEPQAPQPQEEIEVEHSELLHTFEPGRIDTVSEALFEAWKEDNGLLEEAVTKKEFLAEMYGAIAEIEKDPELNAALMEQMSIESGDIDEVQLGDTINLQPFFEYLNQRN